MRVTFEAGKYFVRNSDFMRSHEVMCPLGKSNNHDFAGSSRVKGNPFNCSTCMSAFLGHMLLHTNSKAFRCLFGSSLGNPWNFGNWWRNPLFSSKSPSFPAAAAGYTMQFGDPPTGMSSTCAESARILMVAGC